MIFYGAENKTIHQHQFCCRVAHRIEKRIWLQIVHIVTTECFIVENAFV